MEQAENWRGVRADHFEILRILARGSSGKVLLVKHKASGKTYAMKVVRKPLIISRAEVCETKGGGGGGIPKKLDSPFLVKLHHAFQTSDLLYFVMDYIAGGELFYHLQQERCFPPDRARFYAAEMALGLEYLHSKKITHKNLKPEKILLSSEGHIHITGSSTLRSAQRSDSIFDGSPEYLAPEIIKGTECDSAADYWNLGVLLYEMLTGIPPFYSQDVQQMYTKILFQTAIDFGRIPDTDAQDIITRLLERDPKARLKDPKQIKQHPFFAPIDWDKLANRKLDPPFVPRAPESWNEEDPFTVLEETGTRRAQRESEERRLNAMFDGFTYVGQTRNN